MSERETCLDSAGECGCMLPAGHEGPHECSDKRCGGAWTGSIESEDFRVVRWPGSAPLLAGP